MRHQPSRLVFHVCHDDGVFDIVFGLETYGVPGGSGRTEEHQKRENHGERVFNDEPAQGGNEALESPPCPPVVLGLMSETTVAWS